MYCHYFLDFCLLSDMYSILGLRHLAYMSAVEDDSNKGGLSYSASILMPQPGANRVFSIMHLHHCRTLHSTEGHRNCVWPSSISVTVLIKVLDFLFVCFLLFDCSPWSQSFMSEVVNICRTEHRQQVQINIWKLEVSLYKHVGLTAAGTTNHLTDLINHWYLGMPGLKTNKQKTSWKEKSHFGKRKNK